MASATAATQPPFLARDWLTDDPAGSLDFVLSALQDPAGALRLPYAATFRRRMTLTSLFVDNEAERTLPFGATKQATYQFLDNFDATLTPGSPLPFCETQWAADGERGDDARAAHQRQAQLKQHLLALRFLTSKAGSPLTVDDVLEAHRILMDGAVDDESGAAIRNGAVRDGEAHAGSHQYPEGGSGLLVSMRAVIDAFNTSVEAMDAGSKPHEIVTVPARLFYDMITVHPFQNGNGRLCRVLLMYALMRTGVPFPVPLSSGHKKSRNYYMRAIILARRGNMAELNTLVLVSVEYVLRNYLENVQLSQQRA